MVYEKTLELWPLYDSMVRHGAGPDRADRCDGGVGGFHERGSGDGPAWADYLFGRPLATEEEGEQRAGIWAGIPMLGLDALGSAAYGPEAALTLLIPLGPAGFGYIGPISR